MWRARILVLLSSVFSALAVTLYIPKGQETLFGIEPSTTDTSFASSYTGAAAYNPRTLTPPVPPTDPPVNARFPVQLVNGDIPGLLIRHHGAFLGFSVELSVSNHICKPSLGFLPQSARRPYLIAFSGSQRVPSVHFSFSISHFDYRDAERLCPSLSSTCLLTCRTVAAELPSVLVETLRKPLFWFHPLQTAVLSRKTRAMYTTRYDRYHRPIFPTLIVFIDTNASLGVHSRNTVHDGQHQYSGQRRFVPW
jgi:hypothetical protein